MISKILEFIKDDPEDWEERLEQEHLIRTSHDGDLACFNYCIDADFSDPLVCEARGIILDLKERKVACWPFDKFFNCQEQLAAAIDWGTASVLEKIDGSLVKLYHHHGKWVFATRATCDARSAMVNPYTTFYDVIMKSYNVQEIPFDRLDKDCTYMFELVSPMTQVVIRHQATALYYLAARNNMTGEEIDFDIGMFTKPKAFPLKTLDDCVKAAMELNDGQKEIRHEGFVVVDGHHQRIKVKSPAYITLHRVKANGSFTAKGMLELYLQGEDLAQIAKDFPDDAYIIKYYDWQFEEIKHKIRIMSLFARSLYEEYGHDRKAVARMISDSPYAWAGFISLGNDKTADDIFQNTKPSLLLKLVKERP